MFFLLFRIDPGSFSLVRSPIKVAYFKIAYLVVEKMSANPIKRPFSDQKPSRTLS